MDLYAAFCHDSGMKRRDPDQLKPADASFAAWLARGHEQASAYRKSRDCAGISPQRVAERACRLAVKEQVKARVSELLSEAKVADIDSVGRAHADLLADLAAARAAENWTAVAALTRTRTSILGMVRDNLHVSYEASLSDDQLVKALAGEDAALAITFRKMLRIKDASGPPSSETTY
jgi:hypothetical protein